MGPVSIGLYMNDILVKGEDGSRFHWIIYEHSFLEEDDSTENSE